MKKVKPKEVKVEAEKKKVVRKRRKKGGAVIDTRLINLRVTEAEYMVIQEKSNLWFGGNMTEFLKRLALDSVISYKEGAGLIRGHMATAIEM